jgi:flagellar FliJ protein
MATMLRLREAERDEKRLRLAEAQRAEDVVTGRITEIDAELLDLRTSAARRSRPGPVDVDALMELQRFELLLKAERQSSEEQKRLVAAEVERRRETLVAADREVRTLEKLRDHQLEQHRLDEERRERKRTDEAAIQGFVRKEAHTWRE